jgi:hypothetical protein
MRAKVGEGVVINTCSNSAVDWQSDLSPFLLGPCDLYSGLVSKNMENAWQYSKVYAQHLEDGKITDAWWSWAKEGWNNQRAVRYPVRRGAKPEFARWGTIEEERRLGYVEARKNIYGPLYAKAVIKTDGFRKLKGMYEAGMDLVLRDWDGRNTTETMTEVLNNPKRIMGHAFVLKMLIEEDSALGQFEMEDK